MRLARTSLTPPANPARSPARSPGPPSPAQLLAEFDGLFAPQRARLRAASEDGVSIPEGVPAIDMGDGKSAMTALKICVHCADISNPCKPWDIYSKWTDLVVAEFRRQAAMEIENGIALQGTASYKSTLEESFVLSRMQVRARSSSASDGERCASRRGFSNADSPPPPPPSLMSHPPSRLQLGFIDYIVHPLYTLAGSAQIVDLSEPLNQLNANRARWEASAAADAAASAAAAAAAESSDMDAT